MSVHHGAAVIVHGEDAFSDYILFVIEAVADAGTGKKAGMVSLPCGHCNPGENSYDAALREAREETGYTIQIERKLGDYGQPPVYGSVYVASVVPVALGPIDPEIKSIFWAYPHDVLSGAFGELRHQMRIPLEDYMSQNS